MAAYRRVYDSRHLQADCQKTGISSGTLRSAIEYGLPFLLSHSPQAAEGLVSNNKVGCGERLTLQQACSALQRLDSSPANIRHVGRNADTTTLSWR